MRRACKFSSWIVGLEWRLEGESVYFMAQLAPGEFNSILIAENICGEIQ